MSTETQEQVHVTPESLIDQAKAVWLIDQAKAVGLVGQAIENLARFSPDALAGIIASTKAANDTASKSRIPEAINAVDQQAGRIRRSCANTLNALDNGASADDLGMAANELDAMLAELNGAVRQAANLLRGKESRPSARAASGGTGSKRSPAEAAAAVAHDEQARVARERTNATNNISHALQAGLHVDTLGAVQARAVGVSGHPFALAAYFGMPFGIRQEANAAAVDAALLADAKLNRAVAAAQEKRKAYMAENNGQAPWFDMAEAKGKRAAKAS